MPNTPPDKRKLKQQLSELNALLCTWDPIGVMGARDEYECLAGPILSLLHSGANDAEIENYLRKEIVEHFGLHDMDDFGAVGAKIRVWFDQF